MMQWRRGLTLWFAKPPFAGSTPACISKISEAFFEMQEDMTCVMSVGRLVNRTVRKSKVRSMFW